MTTAIHGVITSPVQMEDRKNLGLKAGDTVKVHQRIIDKGKTRIQIFEGLVLARKHGDEAGATFTVRKMSSGIGVEKIYPLYSPLIEQIEIVKRAKVRRAKLYYIRDKVAREIKRQMRRMSLVSMSTESETDVAARVLAEAKVIEEAAAQAEAEAVKVAEAEAAAQAPAPVVEEVAAEEVVVAEESAPLTEAEAEVVAEATPEVAETPAEEEKTEVA